MKNYEKQSFLNPNNKLSKYIRIFKRDKFIRDFIDYIGFYWQRKKTDWYYLFASDNWRSWYVDKIQIRAEQSKTWWFLAYWLYHYMGYTIDLFRVVEWNLQGKQVLKVDFYGKGLLVVNRENLRNSIEKVFTRFFWMSDIVITRADYTCDCARYNFKKPNRLNNKIAWKVSKEIKKEYLTAEEIEKQIIEEEKKSMIIGEISKNNRVEYLLFGRKGKSARVLRYYDKRRELIARWTAWLYPEYFGFNEIMRYELQVNSEGFDKSEREIRIWDLKDFANFGLYVPDNQASHKKKKDSTELEIAEKAIRKIVRDKNHEDFRKIKELIKSLEFSSRLITENINIKF